MFARGELSCAELERMFIFGENVHFCQATCVSIQIFSMDFTVH